MRGFPGKLVLVPFEALAEQDVVYLPRSVHFIEIHSKEDAVPVLKEFFHSSKPPLLQPGREFALEGIAVPGIPVEQVAEIVGMGGYDLTATRGSVAWSLSGDLGLQQRSSEKWKDRKKKAYGICSHD